jgi:hypothetical protein
MSEQEEVIVLDLAMISKTYMFFSHIENGGEVFPSCDDYIDDWKAGKISCKYIFDIGASFTNHKQDLEILLDYGVISQEDIEKSKGLPVIEIDDEWYLTHYKTQDN